MREFDLLHTIFQGNAQLPSQVTIPPGDDMGAIDLAENQVLITVDQVAEGVHFDLQHCTIEQAARKAITRNLSDVAAMGAVPVGAVAAVALPRNWKTPDAQRWLQTMRLTGLHYHCPVFGGDISTWDHPLLASVTVLAQARGVEPLLRSGAKIGDLVCVTGSLGGSIETIIRPDGSSYTHHLDFEPRLNIARLLASGVQGLVRPHCMIDLSDGLARDLGHICAASRCGAEIWADQLPISDAAKISAQRSGQPAWWHALNDGEDYELCFTIAAGKQQQIPAEIQGVSVRVVGVITATSATINEHAPVSAQSLMMLRLPDGRVEPMGDWGWEHRG